MDLISVGLDLGVGDDLRPVGEVGLDDRIQLGRREIAHRHAGGADLFRGFGRLQRVARRGGELRDRLGRRARGSEQGDPRLELEGGIAGRARKEWFDPPTAGDGSDVTGEVISTETVGDVTFREDA